jgi:hypothetical protein
MKANRGATKRTYGTGLLLVKHGAYYGRWRRPGRPTPQPQARAPEDPGGPSA